MKTIAAFFNNYSTNQNDSDLIIECQRNVCEKELRRLQYGLENLLRNQGYGSVGIKKKSWINRCWPCCRRRNNNRKGDHTNMTDEVTQHYGYDSSSIRDVHVSPSSIGRMKHGIEQKIPDIRTKKATFDPNYKSLFFKILEAQVLDCLGTSQRIDNNSSDSIGTPSSSSSSPHLVTSRISKTNSISSFESPSVPVLPSVTSTANTQLTPPQLSTENNMSGLNAYKKSNLAVPNAKKSRSSRTSSKKSKKPK